MDVVIFMPKILIVDDEPDTVELMKVILEKEGFEILSAGNEKECLEKIRKEKPDLILLDIMMPDMSGWEVYDKIRKNDRKTKVMFVSVVEISEERKKRLIKDGVSDYMMKPFTRDELVRKVKAVIQS